MAGGPILPNSAVPVTDGFVFPNVYIGDGANSQHEEGLGVTDATTLTSDAIWRLRFDLPIDTLPTGTFKCRIISQADAVTGVLKINIKWVSVAMGEDPSSATLNAEGTATITWSTNDDDEYIETLVTLDGDTPISGEIIVMDAVFEDTDSTLAVDSAHKIRLIWED